jgi:DNA-3-methyladenine glycosylase
MRTRRGQQAERLLCAGPGRLAQALAVDANWNGRPLCDLLTRKSRPALVRGRRVGISKGVDLEWRFGAAASRFLSRPFPLLSIRRP